MLTQAGSFVVMAARGADGGTAGARRRRERRQHSWWRHEQLSVAAALGAARDHGAGRVVEEVVTWQDGSEGVVHEVYDAPRGPKPPLRGMRPAPLSEVAGPQGRWVVPACPCGGVPALVPVVMVQEAVHGDATVSYLLLQALLAEQEAKEVEELEAKLTRTEQRLMTLSGELREHAEVRDRLSRLEMAVVTWVMTKTEVVKKKGENRKKRTKRKPPKASSSRWSVGVARGVQEKYDLLGDGFVCGFRVLHAVSTADTVHASAGGLWNWTLLSRAPCAVQASCGV